MSISNTENKAAHKILCIGGSTLNKGTTSKIKDALIKTNFLQEWAVIFVNHSYFWVYGNPMEEATKEYYIEQITEEWGSLSLVFVDKENIYSVNKNQIYILPSFNLTLSKSEEDLFGLFVECKEENKLVKLETVESKGVHKNMGDWLQENSVDALNKPRLKEELNSYQLEMPCIDKIMMELADVKTKIEDLTIAGLILCGRYGDGAYGLKEIKDKGGNTAVQNPKECQGKSRLTIKTAGTTHEYPDPKTDSMPYTALNIDKEQKHQTISIKEESGVISLTEWLESIR